MIVSRALRVAAVWVGAGFASLAWCGVSYGVVRHAMSTGWLSSFVEIAFALNASLSIDKVRKFFLKPFLSSCYARIQELRLLAAEDVSEETIGELTAAAKSAYERFEMRLQEDLCYVVRMGVVCALGCVVALLLGSNESLMPFVPWLFLPVVFFVSGAMIEFLAIVTEFSAQCGNVIENVRVQKEHDKQAFIDSIVPERESE